MMTSKKKATILIASLVAGTFGLHAAYRAANAKTGSPPAVQGPSAGALLPPFSMPAVVVPSDGSIRIETALDRTAVLHRADGTIHVELNLTPNALPGATEALPTDVVVVLDKSSSMEGQKLAYAKQALLGLVDRLRPVDRLGVALFSSDTTVLIPLTHASDDAREGFRSRVRELETSGGTNISAGLDLGVTMLARPTAERAVRMLLLSDGQANAGDTTLAGLMSRARSVGRHDAVLSAIGVGEGFDEHVMTSLASAGTGAFYYLAKLEALPEMLDAELKTAARTHSRGVEIRFRAADGVTIANAGGLVIEKHGDEFVIPVGSLYSARARKVWLTLNVPTGALAERALGRLTLRYRRADKTFDAAIGDLPKVACVADVSRFNHAIAADVWERAMIEEELTRAREELGDAIARGTAADVDRSVNRVEQERALAEYLKKPKVLGMLSELSTEGANAKRAQLASPAERNIAAKREKAIGYGQRNASSYAGADWSRGM
jgi:Ca-activated chloride channel family protein